MIYAPSKDSDQPGFLRWAHRWFCWFCHEAAHLTGFMFKGRVKTVDFSVLCITKISRTHRHRRLPSTVVRYASLQTKVKRKSHAKVDTCTEAVICSYFACSSYYSVLPPTSNAEIELWIGTCRKTEGSVRHLIPNVLCFVVYFSKWTSGEPAICIIVSSEGTRNLEIVPSKTDDWW